MNELELKYGCNPNQKPARVFMKDGGDLPFTVLNGKPGYINLLDAFNSFQLVRELKEATGLPAAASFKHVSPAGAALGLPLDEVDKQIYFVEPDEALSPIACAYIRARGADRLCSYGDWAALSDECDAATAEYLKGEVSDGIIAPSFSEEALAILKTKKGGKYNIVQMDPAYIPAPQEQKDVFGVTFEQGRNNCKIDESLLANIVTENKNLPDDAKRDMIVSLITLKYTQSNSVCYAKDGQTIGVGAGQQSRIHCTRLAGSKADNWYLRRHPKVLALPFVDGIRRPDRDNAIDVYISDECDDVLADGAWQRVFKERPEPLTLQDPSRIHADTFFHTRDNQRIVESNHLALLIKSKVLVGIHQTVDTILTGSYTPDRETATAVCTCHTVERQFIESRIVQVGMQSDEHTFNRFQIRSIEHCSRHLHRIDLRTGRERKCKIP